MVQTARPARRRGLRTLVIGLVVLLVLLLIADRVGDYVAETAAAETLKQSQQLGTRPDVDIDGFPFLTQLAAGDFDRITVSASDFPVGSRTNKIDFDRIRVELDHLTVSRDFSTFHAGTADATATLGYGRLGDALGIRVEYAGNGRIRAEKKITVLGRTITPTVTVAPVLVDSALSFGAAQVNGAGSLAGQVAQILKQTFDLRLPLQGLPFQLRVRSLGADAAGIEVRLTGADLTYRRR